MLSINACTTISPPYQTGTPRLQELSELIQDVKAFGRTIGVEPTEALTRTSAESGPLSMLWLWMQRAGTLALRGPIDIRMAIGFSTERERLKIEQVYRVEGYSVYYRQGNEFADSRSLATAGFSEEPLVRRVKVILHEDLHGEKNFALPWEVEEALVTPLGSLAAVEYFRYKNQEKNLANAITSVDEERKLSRELNRLVAEAEKVFERENVDAAKEKILEILPKFPTYARQFQRQVEGQHKATVLEAKLSHDLAYYRYFDTVCALAEKIPLKTLIEELRLLPADANPERAGSYLQALGHRYSAHAL
jgi:hypothetical protein